MAPSRDLTQIVEISHPEVETHGFVTLGSFEQAWKDKGWVLVGTPDESPDETPAPRGGAAKSKDN